MSSKYKIIKNIISIIDTMIEASEYILKQARKNSFEMYECLYNDIVSTLNAIHIEIANISNDKDVYKKDIVYKNLYSSLYNVNLLFKNNHLYKFKNKLEFELIPLMQEMKQDLYYWYAVYPDKDKINYFNENERIKLSYNKYVDGYELNNDYKYELSIIVLAYNKLEYTKMCINSLLNHIPKILNYELILINHGSTDGTKQYFESINPTKQLDLFVNGWGVACFKRIIEGKYLLIVSNDVLVTENVIENLLKCIKSDNKIGKIVPTTTNVSNLQAIEYEFNNLEEVYEFASKNNVSDEFKWEQRTRLCDPISFYSSKVFCSSEGVMPTSYYLSWDMNSFPDDMASLILRRNGYKLILAKDTFCYHYGSITLKDEIKEKNEVEFYYKGRQTFYNTFGIDPWGKGFCYSRELASNINIIKDGHIDVLGVNCGIGSNSLKIREFIKEKNHKLDIQLININDEQSFDLDLKGISDKYIYCLDTSTYLLNINKKFDYIVIEDNLDKYIIKFKNIINMLDVLLHDNGQMFIAKHNNSDFLLFNNFQGNYNFNIMNEWMIISKNYS